MTSRSTVLALILFLFFGLTAAGAETVFVEADRDATLIEHPEGALANGAGPVFFADRTNQPSNSIRRALIRFDVAGALPGGAIAEAASLTLHLTPSNPVPSRLGLHRVRWDWGEGDSSASGGGGAPSGPGDATWIHTFWDLEEWVRAGGAFVERSSAEQDVGEPGFYTWESSRQLAADVQLWVAAPSRNFGWILIGEETTPQSAKSFASREHPDPALRPFLAVSYRLPGDLPQD